MGSCGSTAGSCFDRAAVLRLREEHTNTMTNDKDCDKSQSERSDKQNASNLDGHLNEKSGFKRSKPPAEHFAAPLSSKLSNYASNTTAIEEMPAPDTVEATHACSIRLKRLAQMIETDDISKTDLLKNLRYTISVLDSVFSDETKRLCNDDDDLPEVAPGAVPNEVREWLASTFTRAHGPLKQRKEKPKFRSVAQAIRAGIMVDKIYKRVAAAPIVNIPADVIPLLKKGIDLWSFDIFTLNDVAQSNGLKYVGYELLLKYDLISKFKIPVNVLENFFNQLQIGYGKYKNPYHNALHGGDVAQTCHFLLSSSLLVNWLSDLEIFATLFAALIHDYEHTGTTNNFHINVGSDLALLYNDKGVLENHHISSVFRLMKTDDINVLAGISKEEFKEFRSLVIDMVLSTDMTLHFQQLKTMKGLLSMPENIDKSKALSLILHCADIAHPAKDWPIHSRWTFQLLEEFFQQGDRERELSLPFSPLCDRNNIQVAQSQIGFIDFIVDPSFRVMGDMLERILTPLVDQQNKSRRDQNSSTCPELSKYILERPWEPHLLANKAEWKRKDEESSPSKRNNLSCIFGNVSGNRQPSINKNNSLTQVDKES